MSVQFPPTPQIGTFPPSGPVTLTNTIESYLYKQFDDDPSLQAFVASFNGMTNVYVQWFATISLPVYTGLSGSLLDWVAQGLYGFERPILSSGKFKAIGPLNTYQLNTQTIDTYRIVGPKNLAVTTDDAFQRCITWNFYKGDGTRFNIRWLKRRIMRFLIGANGTAPNIDQTYSISVTFGANGLASIKLSAIRRKIVGGTVVGEFFLNQLTALNNINTQLIPSPQTIYQLAPVLKEAIDQGVLQLPFQFTWTISVPS